MTDEYEPIRKALRSNRPSPTTRIRITIDEWRAIIAEWRFHHRFGRWWT